MLENGVINELGRIYPTHLSVVPCITEFVSCITVLTTGLGWLSIKCLTSPLLFGIVVRFIRCFYRFTYWITLLDSHAV